MLGKSGTPGESRTPNLLIRSQALYPIELRVQEAKSIKIKKAEQEERNKVFGQQLKRLEYKRGVMSSKTRIITQGYINTFLTGFIGNII